MAYDNEMVVADANGANVNVVTKAYSTREVQVVELGLAGALVDEATNPLPVTAEITSGTVVATGNVGLDPIPTTATYFKYGARLSVGSTEIKACPAGGRIVVKGIRVRSKTDASSTVVVFFDVDNDGGGFDSGTDEQIEDIDLQSSATSHPGSNSGEIHMIGGTDKDLRVEVIGTGTAAVMVWGYTLPV